MNKKRLSVVMAGAMLASSVAPVLAAETTTQKEYTVNNSNKGLLIKELRKLILEGGTFENVDINGELAGHSVHYATIDGGETVTTNKKTVAKVGPGYKTFLEEVNAELENLGLKGRLDKKDVKSGGEKTVNLSDATVIFTVPAGQEDAGEYKITYAKRYDNKNIADLETLIQKAKANTKIRVWDNGHVEKDGKYYGKTLEETKVAHKFTKTDLEKEYNDFVNAANKNDYKAVYKMELKDDVLTVYTRFVREQTEDTRQKKEYTVGSDYVDFKKPIAMDGNAALPNDTDDQGNKWITTEIKEFGLKDEKYDIVTKGKDIANKELYTVTISNVDAEHKVVLSDLYDGLFLTEKGEELLEALKEYDAKKEEGKEYDATRDITVEQGANGLYSITINFKKKINKETIRTQVVVTTNDKEKILFFAKGISAKVNANPHKPGTNVRTRKFPVQKLVGTDRHETAVKVARENADIKTVAENGNIVLVNSDSLVDGLAAAPLAASVWNKNSTTSGLNGNYVAPILLTNRDGLDKVTKDYIKEVVAHQRVGALDKVTVYLVGGEAVISKAVENDLKEAGLRVVRAGGKDREETSLKVAKLIEKDTEANFDNAFLVGANGEADAMSVASVAADTTLKSTGKQVTPIIVESVHGISEGTIEYLRGYKSADTGKNVTIVGGEKVVSKATEDLLKEELKGKAVERVQGANRKATNAKVIDTFYAPGTLDHILVSKDGIARKGELIDALTATSIAAKYHTPIVLGTNDLTREQIEAIEDRTNRSQERYLYQIGGNVAPSVMKTIADRLSLSR